MMWDDNIVSRADYKLFRFSFIRYHHADFFRTNIAVKRFLPVELSGKQAAEMFSERYLETKISYSEYERWNEMLMGSGVGMLEEFYKEMVRKYIPNWHILGLLIYLFDLQNGKKEV